MITEYYVSNNGGVSHKGELQDDINTKPSRDFLSASLILNDPSFNFKGMPKIRMLKTLDGYVCQQQGFNISIRKNKNNPKNCTLKIEKV